LSQRLGEEGRVMLRVYVAPDGTASEVQVRESSGWPRLDRAAHEAVERWKFAPAREGDRAIGAWVVVPVNFSLIRQG
jgi:protein TonB